MVCLGNICINTLHKGAKDDDDDDNNNNNNNNNKPALVASCDHPAELCSPLLHSKISVHTDIA
jgi:hypothetical protein